MKIWKKLPLAALCALLSFSLVGCQQNTQEKKVDVTLQKEFDTFIEQSFIDELQEDYLTTHLYFEHPETYGINKAEIKVTLGERYSSDMQDKDEKAFKEKQKKFKAFDRDKLSSEQQDTYDIYASNLKAEEKLLKEEYQFLSNPFEEGSGLHVSLTQIFADYPIREEQDIKDLITLLNDVLPYIDSTLQYTKDQAEKGTLMIDIDSVSEFCDKIIQKGAKSDILQAMKTSVNNINISQEKKDDYHKQIETAFTTSFVEAYKDIKSTFESLSSAKNNKQGLSHLENGKAYYETLVQKETASDKSIKEIKDLLNKTADKYFNKLIMLASVNQTGYENIVEGKIKTGYSDYTTMLKDLRSKIKGSFPETKDNNYDAKSMNPEVASGMIGAYFMVPPIDHTAPMVIRVNDTNEDLKINDPKIFVTVAHEGFPGHMYQNSYVREHFKSPYRIFESSNSSYVEGYAKYVELLSYSYIDGVEEDVAEMMKCNDIYIYCKLVVADIGIHYEGWDIEKFTSYLKEIGLSVDNKEAVQSQYDQLQNNPGAFIPYFVGFCAFDSLRDQAEKKLGDAFDELAFHEAILKSGEAPFSVVEKNVNAYIAANK